MGEEIWPGVCCPGSVKKAFSKGGRRKHGFLRATLSPVNDKQEPTFGLLDALLIFALVTGSVAVARHLLAH